MDKQNIIKSDKQLWHSLPLDKVFSLLSSNSEGLPQSEVEKRLVKYGLNELPHKKPSSAGFIFWDQFKNVLIVILVLAGLVTLLLGEYIDALVIILAVIVNVILGFIQERRAEKALYELNKVISYQAVVRRGGELHTVNANELVIGDVVELRAGDRVPADARIIDSYSLQTNEAILTGESMPVVKSAGEILSGVVLAERTNMVYLGTQVVSGTATVIVVDTGFNTELGKIAKEITETERGKTPLQKKLAGLGKGISVVVVITCLIVFFSGVLLGFNTIQMFTTAIAIAVSAVPEGLVIVLTAILALGMQRILARRGLVRKLIATETLGSTTVICTDKTGTLTSGQMQVALVWTFNESKRKFSEDLADGSVMSELLKVGVLASDAYIENPQDELKEWIINGNPTEKALLLVAVQSGISIITLRNFYQRLDEIPFDAEHKFMITLHYNHHHEYWVYLKGAPEAVLERSHYYQLAKQEKKLTKETKSKILEQMAFFSSQGLRPLAFAYRRLDQPAKKLSQVQNLDTDFVFLGMVGIKDPIRPEVAHSLQLAKEAGIQVVVITGDNKFTAQAVARELNLPAGDDNIVEGGELVCWEDSYLQKRLNKLSIFARATPHDKPRIVNAFQARGDVVAMTGDGVNDAPALKSADIGVALGSGSDVAKEAADLVLLDDDFTTIVSAIEEGRTIYQNIRKMVLYVLSDSFSETMVVLGSFFIGAVWHEALPLPILATQILWINLVTDSMPALAFTVEPPSPEAMSEPPIKLSSPILDKKRVWLIAFMGTIRGLVALYLFMLIWYTSGNEMYVRTLVFTLLVITSLFYALNCKQMRFSIWHKRSWNNPFLIMALVVALLFQLAVVYVPFLQQALHTVPLGILDWLMIVLLAGVISLMVEAIKSIFAKIFRR